jgi:cation:H+ antiporter
MHVQVLTVLLGVIIVVALAEIIIKYAIEISKHYGLSGTFIGLTLLSIGTSIPEIMTHVIGSINILRDPTQLNTISSLVLGTNVGSDIFQQNFVLPLVGIIGVIVVKKKNLFTEMGGLISAAALVWVFALGGIITRWEGAILLIAYVAYLLYLKMSKISVDFQAKNHLSQRDLALGFSLIFVSFIIISFVADKVLDASTILIKMLPISASFFGIIILGVATALPELTTSLVAVLKKNQDISAGILIGSNITNPLFGIGLGAVISTYTVPTVITLYDLPIKLATAGLLYYFLMKSKRLAKSHAFVLIGLFILYIIVRQIYFPLDW